MRIPHKLAPTAALPPTYAVLERKKAPPQNKIVLRRGLVCPGGENTPKGRLRRAEDRKKVLSLVLCVAMMLSVMVMGAGAAFTDQDKIVNEEAVDMISALGIVDGYEDDSFQPEKNIERGEAAKMIAVMLNGGKDAIQDATGSSFNDVLGGADAWANKYIEYCASEKIVAGVGGDRFAPASNVTGTQLAKMLLVSLGYDPIKEGYQNDNTWAVDVNTDAVKAGLFEGIENVDMSAALTRDNAAQMIWNALQADTVWYTSAGEIMKGQSLLAQAYDAYVVTGIMTKVDHYNKDAGKYTYTIDGSKYKYTSTTDYSDMFAMNVTAVVNYSKKALNVYADYSDVIASANVGDINEIEVTNGNVTIPKEVTSLTINGTKYGVDNVKDDVNLRIAFYNDYESEIQKAANNSIKVQYAFRAIDTDNGGDIDTIVVYPYIVLKTDAVTSDSFRINTLTSSDAYLVAVNSSSQYTQDEKLFNAWLANPTSTVTTSDVIVNGDIAIDGYVKAVPAEYTATGMDTYTVLTAQSAALTKGADKDYMLTLGNTEYDGSLLSPISAIDKLSLDKSYSYIEVNGYLFVVDGSGIVPAATDYVVATKVAPSSATVNGTYDTTLLFSDGTSKVVEAKRANGDAAYVGDLYTYSIDKDGNYILNNVFTGTKDDADVTCVFDYQENLRGNGETYTPHLSEAYHDNTFVVKDAFDLNSNDVPCFTSQTYEPNTLWTIDDDAVIFAFIDRTNTRNVVDYRGDEYVVLTGADLKDLEESDVNGVAFVAADIQSQGVATVQMGYVYLTADPRDEAPVYAYVDGAPSRVPGYSVSVPVITSAGEETLTTPNYFEQKDQTLDAIYNNLVKGDVVKAILDKDGMLVGYEKVTFATVTDTEVTAYNPDNGSFTVNGTQYFIGEGTVIINVSGEKLQVGTYVSYDADRDLLVIY